MEQPNMEQPNMEQPNMEQPNMEQPNMEQPNMEQPNEQPNVKGLRIYLEGVVQGVGFRPFVYKLANEQHLGGFVYNSGQGLVIEVEGDRLKVEAFLERLLATPPSLSVISDSRVQPIAAVGRTSFEIIASRAGNSREALIPPDVALCADCRREVLDSTDRHYCYPFTNCTNCGPRFTIVRDLPYDRGQTSMAGFRTCPDCAGEYHDPGDRRFHAQPAACPACGPQVWLTGREEPGLANTDWPEQFRRAIRAGKIVAVKGLGGFHLACNALNEQAVLALRNRKNRPAKPLAVMARDLAVVHKYCLVSADEERVLQSPAAPIVILQKNTCGTGLPAGPDLSEQEFPTLPAALAPGVRTLGVMLPYTPQHLLLFDDTVEMLVMTSGNRSGLPLARDNAEALAELKDIADLFILHNRPIINRCDDSVVRLAGQEIQYFRRSRGYVPQPVHIPKNLNPAAIAGAAGIAVLGLGSEMKNTFCLLKADRAFLSQHIGRMETEENLENYLESLTNFQRLTNIAPQVCGYDLHPGYRVSKLADRMAIPAIPVQHHHAHLAACQAENGLEGRTLGLILDGTGYGLDGGIWGFEVLAGDYREFERLLHLAYVPLPGAESAVRNPWRTAEAYLAMAFGAEAEDLCKRIFPEYAQELAVVLKISRAKVNAPPAGSCGRLFDAVAALTGVCRENTYDGQAAVELSEQAEMGEAAKGSYPFRIDGEVIDPLPAVREITRQVLQGVESWKIAQKFQHTVVEMLCTAANQGRELTGLTRVSLSGGSWQNGFLFNQVRQRLEQAKFQVFYHRKVPANDGGLALGQAMIAGRRWMENVFGGTGKSCGISR